MKYVQITELTVQKDSICTQHLGLDFLFLFFHSRGRYCFVLHKNK